MSDRVYLARCAREDFDRTVAASPDVGDDADAPAALADPDDVRFYGVHEGDRAESVFAEMAAGDLVLFHDDGYVATARIAETVTDEAGWASEHVWTSTDATHLYTLTDVTPVAVPAAAVNGLFGYSPGYAPPALLRVAEDRVDASPDTIERALQQYTDKHADGS